MKFLYIIIIIIPFLFCACGTLDSSRNIDPDFEQQRQDAQETIEIVDETRSGIDESTTNIVKEAEKGKKETKKIKRHTENIKKETKKGKQKEPELSEWERIDKESDSIEESNNNIRRSISAIEKENSEIISLSKKLDEARRNLSESEKEIIRTEKAYDELLREKDKLKKEKEKLKKSLEQENNMVWIWLMSFCGLCFGVGVFMLVWGQYKLGASLAAGSLLMFGGIYLMSNFAIYIAIFSLLLIVGVALYVTYDKYCHEKALEETVNGFEEVKGSNWDNDTKNRIKRIQSLKTKELINKIKLKKFQNN